MVVEHLIARQFGSRFPKFFNLKTEISRARFFPLNELLPLRVYFGALPERFML
jgi:hypothetical protein